MHVSGIDYRYVVHVQSNTFRPVSIVLSEAAWQYCTCATVEELERAVVAVEIVTQVAVHSTKRYSGQGAGPSCSTDHRNTMPLYLPGIHKSFSNPYSLFMICISLPHPRRVFSIF